MNSTKQQKRNVLIAAFITLLIFSGYVIYQNVSFKTEWKYVEYNNGYKLVSYTQAFNDNTTEISVPAQYEGKYVVAIDDKAFYKNKKIKKVIIPDTVTELGSSVFKECRKLESVELSKNTSVMGGECFKDCKSLTAIILPDSLTEIRGETFMGCSSLKTVVLPNKITEIKGNTFENCSSLEIINIPSGVTRIAAHAFYGCTSLFNVFVPDTVKEIGSSAFRLCDSLETIELPEGVSINERAFKESPTRILEKQIPDDLWGEIINEIQNKDNYEALYVIYDKAKGPEEVLIRNGIVCVVDSIKYEEIIKDGFALREFTETDELVTYLEYAKEMGAKYAQCEFYTEIGSEKVGHPYFATSSEYIDDLIADLQVSEELNNSIADVENYDAVPEAQIDTNIGSNSTFYMGDIETYVVPDNATNSGLKAAESIGE